MKSYTHCLLSLPLLPLFAAAVYADPQISYNELHTRPIDRVPEKVRVTDRFTTHGKTAADGYVDILDQIPENCVFIASGKIRVSDRVSRAGAKSIRWDWKAGDVLRLQDAGIVSDVRPGWQCHLGCHWLASAFPVGAWQFERRYPL